MERMNETNELEEMRAQMALLKEKLNKEEILTDNLLKQAMTGKMSTINRYKWISLFAALFALTFGNMSWYQIGLPLRFLIGTSVLMVLCVVVMWIIHAKMDERDIMDGNMLEVAKNAKKLKITLVKSTIGAVPKNKAVIKSMGFHKLGSSVILPDNESTRGQIRLIAPFVKVEDAE